MDDMFHQETGLDDADDEDDGDGESLLLSLPLVLGGRWLESEGVLSLSFPRVAALSVDEVLSRRDMGLSSPPRGSPYLFSLSTMTLFTSFVSHSSLLPPKSLNSYSRSAQVLPLPPPTAALAPLELADIQKLQMVNPQNANVTHQASHNLINQVDSPI